MGRDLRKVAPPPWVDPPVMIEGSDSPWPSARRYSVGDCWYATRDPRGGWTMYADGPDVDRCALRVSVEHTYETPIIVVLPSRLHFQGVPFCVHAPTMTEQGFGPGGWRIEGSIDDDPISLTVTPSIDMPRHWHGWIKSGWLEDA